MLALLCFSCVNTINKTLTSQFPLFFLFTFLFPDTCVSREFTQKLPISSESTAAAPGTSRSNCGRSNCMPGTHQQRTAKTKSSITCKKIFGLHQDTSHPVHSLYSLCQLLVMFICLFLQWWAGSWWCNGHWAGLPNLVRLPECPCLSRHTQPFPGGEFD